MTQSCIFHTCYTKFGQNWLGSFKENFLKMDDGRRLTLIVIGHPKDLKIYDICSKKKMF